MRTRQFASRTPPLTVSFGIHELCIPVLANYTIGYTSSPKDQMERPSLIAFRIAFLLTIAASHVEGADGPEHIQLTLGQELTNQRAECMQYTYYAVDVVNPCKDLRIKVTQVGGEPNVYVSKYPNKYPVYLSLAWSSYNWGGEDLIISSWDPEFTVGTYYIGIHSFCSEEVHTGDNAARYSILAESVRTSHPSSEIAMGGDVNSTLAANGYHYYRFCVPDTCSDIEVRLENCLDTTVCPENYAYPELLVSRSIVEPSINDHAWKLADISQRSVYLKRADPEFFPGHHFVGVFGWCTPDDQCPDVQTCGPCQYANGHPYTVSMVVGEEEEGCTSRQPLEVCEGGNGGVVSTVELPLLVAAIVAAKLTSSFAE